MIKIGPNKSGFNIIFVTFFIENLIQYVAIHDFSVWLRTGSYPPGYNLYRNYTGNALTGIGGILFVLNSLCREGEAIAYSVAITEFSSLPGFLKIHKIKNENIHKSEALKF